MISALALAQQRDRSATPFPFRSDDTAETVHGSFVETRRFRAHKSPEQTRHHPLARPHPIEQRAHCGMAPHWPVMLTTHHLAGNYVCGAPRFAYNSKAWATRAAHRKNVAPAVSPKLPGRESRP